jgi:PAS domain S-box-containing protein
MPAACGRTGWLNGMADLEDMVKRQRILADFGEFALRNEDLDAVLAEACRLVHQALGADLAKVVEIDHGRQELLVRAGIGWQPGIVGVARLPMGERSSETYSVELAQPVVTRDLAAEKRFEFPEFLKQHDVVALVNVPIFLPGGHAYGLLQVDSRATRDFGPEDVEFLRTYATILGPVIDRLHKIRRLLTTEERLRRVVETEAVGLIIFDHAGTVVDANGVFLRMTGYTRGDISSGTLTWRRMTPPEWVAASEAEMEKFGRTGRIGPYEKEYILADGSRGWMLLAGRDLGDGTVAEHCIDIGDRKRAEAALRESEGRLRALVEGIPQLVWRAAGGGRWSWAGPQWCAFTGLSPEASLSHGWLQAVHPEDRAGAVVAWATAAATGLLEVDYRVRHAASGRYDWFQTRALPVRGDGGEAVEWVGTSTDITDQMLAREVLARGRTELEALVAARTAELMAAEETLRQAQKMEAVGQLTGGIAHDFNNMLQGVAGGLDMARRRIEQGRTDEAGRYLDASRTAVGRAAGLTRRLLTFARRQRHERSAVDADGLVAGMADLIRRTMGPGVAVELRLRDGTGSVLCDSNELESALLNLCINARDAMQGGGRLAIGTEEVRLSGTDLRGEEAEPGRYLALSVADTGTGMPPEVLDRAFEPFFTTKLLGEGTGLGLSQVWGFAHQSGGLVRIESAPGAGTTVRLLLPLHDIAAVAAEAPRVQGPPRATSAATVLLVDDEEGVRQPAADRLRDLGHLVLEAANGREALQILSGTRPDLLVTDVGLPGGMNGRQVAETARERVPGLPVLFITGYAGAVLPPGVEVIGKPFDLDTLARRVSVLLARRPRPDATSPRA